MGDTTAAALLIEQTAKPAFLLDGAFLHQRNPLVTVDEIFILFEEQVIRLADNTGTVLGRNHLDIEGEVARERILNLVHDIQNLRRELHGFIGVALAAELVGINQAEEIHDLVHADAADGAELLVQLHRAVLIVGQEPLLDVALDDVAHGCQRLAVQKDALAENFQVLLLRLFF